MEKEYTPDRTPEVANIPPVKDAAYAVICYHTKNQITPSDISRIFDRSKSFCYHLVNRTKEAFRKRNVPIWCEGALSTVAAYQVWGIDIEHLEAGIARLKELGL